MTKVSTKQDGGCIFAFSKSDVLMSIAEELRDLDNRFDDLDRLSFGANAETRNQQAAEIEQLDDRRSILREAATCVRAQSIAGALLQASVLKTQTEALCMGTLDEVDRMVTGRAVDRLIYSIIHALRTQVEPEMLKRMPKFNDHIDPWKISEVRLAPNAENRIADA